FPRDRVGYREALARALNGDDEALFNLVRLFGREAEKRAWFRCREERAHRERDAGFFRRYAAARTKPPDWQKHKQALRRLFLLTVFEPEIRGRKPREIHAFLKAWCAAGWLPAKELPSLGTLRKYLTTRLGW